MIPLSASRRARSSAPLAGSTNGAANPLPRLREDGVDAATATWGSWFGLPVLLLISHAVLAWIGRMPGLFGWEDDARYLILARSLKQGTYRELWFPGLPLHHMYPPGYPALLAVWTSIGGQSIDWILVLQIAMNVTSLWLMFEAIRRWMPAVASICALAITALNPELIGLAGHVVSEPAMMLFLTMSVWAAATPERGRKRTAVMVGAAFLAPFCRTEAIVVPAALIAMSLWQRRSNTWLLAVAFICIVGPLIYWTLHDPNGVVGNSYAADFTKVGAASSPLPVVLVKRSISNAVYYAMRAVPYIFPMPGVLRSTVARSLATLLIMAGLGVGMFVSFKRLTHGVLTLLACAAIFLVWPWQLARYLVPFLTLIVPLSIFGLLRIGRFLAPRAAGVLVYGTTALALLTGASHNRAQIAPRLDCRRGGVYPDDSCVGPEAQKLFKGLKMVSDSLPPDAHVLAAKGATLFYYTGRQGVRSLTMAGLDSGQYWSRLSHLGVGYVLLGEYEPDGFALAALRTRCASLQPVGSLPANFHLLRVQTTSAGAPAPTISASAGDSAPGCIALRQYSAVVPSFSDGSRKP